jgi:hypothetical protein
MWPLLLGTPAGPTPQTGCYILDLQCPPKAYVLEALPQLGVIGRWWSIYEVGSSGRFSGHGGASLKGYWEHSLFLYLLLFFLAF